MSNPLPKMNNLKDCPSFGDVCYRHGKYRWVCDVCEKESPNCFLKCRMYDPRNIPPRGEYVCERCGKTYRNWMCSIRHHINCESVFIHNVSKLVVNADGSPLVVNGATLIRLNESQEKEVEQK